ncbi:MAG: c-type cytochrome [Burkholderiales bacterium]
MTALVRAIAALGLVFVTWLLWGSQSRDETMRAPMVRTAVKHPWLVVGAMASAAVVLGALMVISGVASIKASSGHWPITAAFLDFAKTRSVATHSWGTKAPPLEDEAMVVRGAGHYETACVSCHGGPGRGIPPVVRAMTPPPPPEFADRLARWTPEELFTIVKHGIKFTGMPAWPVQQRDDEIWAMVAFLRRMPQLDATEYQTLVFGATRNGQASQELTRAGDRAPPRAVREMCSRCHGVTGTGRSGAFPTLAGQRSDYLNGSLHAFRNGTRFSAIMSEVAAKLDDAAMREVSAYYEALPARVPEQPVREVAAGKGRTIAMHGFPERDIPACVECHGPATRPKNRSYPRLTSQHASYLVSQLLLMQQGRRGGTPNVDLMHVFVKRLRHAEIQHVAEFYATLPMNAESSAERR